MEQAINQFNKGLQIDTNPMMQGSDTLTDCLNGTLITMNGNEVILQNDMGNGRVDNAFLPPGYQPVGMKEYGGIIYVASYNPITNKSQLGSFPSPQRKIDNLSENIEPTSFDFSKFTQESNTSIDYNLGIRVLNNDTFLIPISQNINIHSGDKFVVYSPGLSEMSSDITNYNNTIENKIISPKNKKYTLEIGILNSQNEFVNITKTLNRWIRLDGEISQKLLSKEEDISDEQYFNKGYFIPDNLPEMEQSETIQDEELLLSRQKLDTNTYTYKLVGPLYLKIKYNHIQNFSYNITGFVDSNKLKIIIEGYITYNCPDNISGPFIPIESEKYSTYEEGVLNNSNNFGFDLIGFQDCDNIKYSQTKYDPINNTYSMKVTKTWEDITIQDDWNGVFNYTIGVLANPLDIDNDSEATRIYLKECSSKGQIDLSLLESNKLILNEWRFYNSPQEKTSSLVYNFNVYPRETEILDDLKIKFTNLIDSSDQFFYPSVGKIPFYNGRNVINLDWEDKIKPKTTYKINFIYNILDKETREIIQENIPIEEDVERWFISTELFNDLYLQSSGMFDFCDNSKIPSTFNRDVVLENFNKKLDIPFTFTYDLNTQKQSESEQLQGSLLSKTYDIEFKNEKIQNLNLNILNATSQLILDNYPNYIEQIGEISYSISDLKVKINGKKPFNQYNIPSTFKFTLNPISFSDIIEESSPYEGKMEEFNNSPLLDLNATIHTIENGIQIKWRNSYFDYYFGYSEQPLQHIKNVFDDFSEVIKDVMPSRGYYSGIFPIFGNSGSEIRMYVRGETDIEDGNSIQLDHGDLLSGFETPPPMYVTDYKDTIFQNFNNNSKLGQIFQYHFSPEQVVINNNFNNLHLQRGARVWWKASNDEWYLIPDVLTKDILEPNTSAGDFITYITNKLNTNYVYCVYDNYEYNRMHPIYASSNNHLHNIQYSFPLDLELQFTKISGSDFNSINYGNLIFTTQIFNITKTLENIFQLESSQNFHNIVNSFDYNNVSNVYLKTAKQFDSLGNILDKNKIYKTSTNLVLIPVPEPTLFSIDTINKANNKNVLLLKSNRYNLLTNNEYDSYILRPSNNIGTGIYYGGMKGASI